MSVPVFIILNPRTGAYYGREPGAKKDSWVREPKCIGMWLDRVLAEATLAKVKKQRGKQDCTIVSAVCHGSPADGTVMVSTGEQN